MRVCDDAGATKGWRPPGGGIELGERAAETIVRELREELDVEATVTRFVGVLENIYEHHGATGHELVMVHDAVLAIERARYEIVDGGVAIELVWVALEAFRTGREQLFPTGLLGLLDV